MPSEDIKTSFNSMYYLVLKNMNEASEEIKSFFLDDSEDETFQEIIKSSLQSNSENCQEIIQTNSEIHQEKIQTKNNELCQEIIRPPLALYENELNFKPQEIRRPPSKTNDVEINVPTLKSSATTTTENTPKLDENNNIITECAFTRTTSSGGLGGQKRSKWTDLELNYLERGMEEFGTRWEDILKHYGRPHGALRNRTAMNLKDKARNEKARRIRDGIQLGVFKLATS
ncbi:myb DNA binding protein [Gigaspora margarita]|uniref:Myb DNA binding protein n=1 Tax=Gigaspora margarita TaxID=4874 RepID=A0A8H4ASC8_GIGMA|nr:myb DNA binding protein [Gigaspora margarita]